MRARLESESESEIVGDLRSVLRPGESAYGLGFDEWLKLTPGEVLVTEGDGKPPRVERVES